MDFESELTPPIETEEQLEQRQEKEREEFYIQCKNRLKGTKKNAKKQLEIECVQLEYELKRKHKDEELLLEQQIGKRKDKNVGLLFLQYIIALSAILRIVVWICVLG